MSQPIAAPRNAPLELKLQIMLRNWGYGEFKETLYEAARSERDYREANVFKRLYAFLRAVELHQAGQSQYEIRSRIMFEIKYRLSKRYLYYWLRSERTPFGRMNVFDVRAPQVGVVLGAVLTDGSEYAHCSQSSSVSWRIEFHNKRGPFIAEFIEAARQLDLSVVEKKEPTKYGAWTLRISSALLYLLLQHFDTFIMKAPADVQYAFLRAAWMGDGHLRHDTVFTNTDIKIIAVIQDLLWKHGIKCKKLGPYIPSRGKKPYFKVRVRSCSEEMFFNVTGLWEFAESLPRPFPLCQVSLLKLP